MHCNTIQGSTHKEAIASRVKRKDSNCYCTIPFWCNTSQMPANSAKGCFSTFIPRALSSSAIDHTYICTLHAHNTYTVHMYTLTSRLIHNSVFQFIWHEVASLNNNFERLLHFHILLQHCTALYV